MHDVFVSKSGSIVPIPSRVAKHRDAQHVEQYKRVAMTPYLLASSKQPDSRFLFTNMVVDDVRKGASPKG
jgi:hypothetical protein